MAEELDWRLFGNVTDLQKDIVQVTFEDTGVDKKHIRKLAVIYHKQSMNDVKSDYEDLEALYDELFK